jgi:hypothetical protein
LKGNSNLLSGKTKRIVFFFKSWKEFVFILWW